MEDPALVPSLRLLFPHYEVAASSANPAFAITVQRNDRGWTVAEQGARHICATVTEVAEAVEFALTETFLRLQSNRAHVHAAAVILGRGATLLLGGPGAGKTSLAFWCSRAGRPVLADDVTLVQPSGRVQPFKRLFKVDPRLVTEAGVPLESTRLWEPSAETAWYDPADGGGWADEAPVSAIGLLRRAPGGAPETRPVPRREALNALMHSLLATGAQGTAAFGILADAVRDTATFEIRFDSAAEAVAVLERTVA